MNETFPSEYLRHEREWETTNKAQAGLWSMVSTRTNLYYSNFGFYDFHYEIEKLSEFFNIFNRYLSGWVAWKNPKVVVSELSEY